MCAPMRERIGEFVHHKRLTMAEFERQCGLSNGYVSSMRRGVGSIKLRQILKAFPDLNRDWLLFGEGEMLKKTESVPIVQNVEQTNSQGNISIDSNLARVVAEQSRQISKLIEMVDRLTHADGDREGSK